jgi:hypothetical protein
MGKNHPLYKVWYQMIARCHNPRGFAYEKYGAKGTTVCDRWRTDFHTFVADIGPRPPGTTLDRRDNSKGYEPGNCRWATNAEQASNRTNNRLFTFEGRTQTASQWAREKNLNLRTLYGRLRIGWTIERALTAPLRAKKPLWRDGMSRTTWYRKHPHERREAPASGPGRPRRIRRWSRRRVLAVADVPLE